MSSSSVLLTISLLIAGTLYGNSPIETHGSPFDYLKQATNTVVGNGIKAGSHIATGIMKGAEGVARGTATLTGVGLEEVGAVGGALNRGTHAIGTGITNAVYSAVSGTSNAIYSGTQRLFNNVQETGSNLQNFGRYGNRKWNDAEDNMMRNGNNLGDKVLNGQGFR